MGIMEKKMETIGSIRLYSILFGDTMVPIMENQMEKKMENEMESGII